MFRSSTPGNFLQLFYAHNPFFFFSKNKTIDKFFQHLPINSKLINYGGGHTFIGVNSAKIVLFPC